MLPATVTGCHLTHERGQRSLSLKWRVTSARPDAPVLIDVRNGYEWDVGHFQGAVRPVQESFRETVDTNTEEGSGPLAGVDKTRPIMMYCTGGIRCDVYSTVLKVGTSGNYSKHRRVAWHSTQ